MARLGPKKQRLTRAEWKAQKARYESRSSGECGARFRRAEGKGGSQEPPSRTGAGGVASKEKRATREAMQKALALQAEARKNRAIGGPSSPIRASRCATPADAAPEGRGGYSKGEFGL